MAAGNLTLWGAASIRALRAHWLLHEMGLDYDFVPARPRGPESTAPEFLALNPRHKIPVLQHGTLVLTESAAIVQYISEVFPAPDHLYVPADAAGRARVAEWAFFAMTELDAHSLYVIRKHVDLQHLYGDAPAAVAAARTYFTQQLEKMAPRIGIEHPYLVGDRLSTADILLASCLYWGRSIAIPMPESVMAYLERLSARHAFQEAVARTFPGREVA